MAEELLTIPEAGKTLKAGRTYLYRLINEGQIKAVKIGRKTLIPRSALEAYIAALPQYKTETKNGA